MCEHLKCFCVTLQAGSLGSLCSAFVRRLPSYFESSCVVRSSLSLPNPHLCLLLFQKFHMLSLFGLVISFRQLIGVVVSERDWSGLQSLETKEQLEQCS